MQTRSQTIRTENIQTTLGSLNADFAGRRTSPDYDASRLVHIHRRNRAFVWNATMQERMLDSILKGFYIPPIICSQTVVDGQERREVMEGGNRITSSRRILNGEVRALTPEERRIVEAFPITLVVIRGLNAKQQREMFRRLNKNVKVSDGQLYAMSEEDSPLIQEALALLNSTDHPLRETITEHFGDTRGSDNAGQSSLSNAVALVSGAINGPNYITKSFDHQEEQVNKQTPIQRNVVVEMLGNAFEVFNLANTIEPLTDGRRKKGQMSVGNKLGVILYDLHAAKTPAEITAVQRKWATYIVRIRREVSMAQTLQDMRIWSANLTADRHMRISTMVSVYLQENRIMTKEEIAEIRHPRAEDIESEGSEDSDDEGDDSDE